MWRIGGGRVGVAVVFLEAALAVEGDEAADDHVTDLDVGADAAAGAGRDHQTGLAVFDDLLPHQRVRELRAVLGHMRVRLEQRHSLVTDRRCPVGAEPLVLPGRAAGPHCGADRLVVLGVRLPAVMAVDTGCEHTAERVSFVHGPGHDQHVGFRQRRTPRPSSGLGGEPGRPLDLDELGEPARGRCGQSAECRSLRRFGVEVDQLPLQRLLINRLIRSKPGGACSRLVADA